MGRIGLEEVAYVARLARLSLSPEHMERMTRDLNSILEYAARIGELKTDDVPPTAHILPVSNVTREDTVQPSYPVEEVLANAPQRRAGSFVVPPVIE